MRNIKIDMHVHTIFSGDSLIKPVDLIKYAKRSNLDGIAICDHDTLTAYRILEKINKNENFIIIPAMEIKTNIGEIIGYFLEEEISTEDNNFFTIIKKIKKQNGLVVIPHPFDFLRNNRLKMKLITEKILKKYIDGIELMNSRIIFKSCISKTQDFLSKYKKTLFETGGSDAHTVREIGNGFTLINNLSDFSLESIKKALLTKNSKSMGHLSSPFVHVTTVLNKLKKGYYF
ncbi:MAG: PHP domain-containing protein [Promethearchaeia archaeon]